MGSGGPVTKYSLRLAALSYTSTVLIKHHQIITRNHIRYILDKSNTQISINYSTIGISNCCHLIGKRSSSLCCTLHCMPL